jgi:hypothetical protein
MAVHERHHHVRNHKIVRRREATQLDSSARILRHLNLVTTAKKDVIQKLPDLGFIVDYEHSRHANQERFACAASRR